MIMQFRGHSFPRVATTARSRCIAEGHRGGTMLGAKARLSLCVSSTAADQPSGPTMLKNRDYSILASPVGMGGEAPSSNGGGIMAPSAKLSGCSMEPALRFAPQPWAPQFPAASRWPRTGMSARSLVYQQLQQFFCAPAYSCEPGLDGLTDRARVHRAGFPGSSGQCCCAGRFVPGSEFPGSAMECYSLARSRPKAVVLLSLR